MATVIRESIGLLNDRITVKISKDDYYPSFEKSIKEYSKKANIPGFRKGMVPPGMVKKMYGPSIFYDELIKVVDKEIQQYLINENPDIFAQPLPLPVDLRNLDMNSPADYDFPFEIGLKPEIKIPDLQNAGLTLYKVKVSDEMIDEEIERLHARYGTISEPETVSSEENILDVSFEETDATGEPVANGILKESSLRVKDFAQPLKDQLMGKTKDDTIRISAESAFEGEAKEKIMHDLGIAEGGPDAVAKKFKLTIENIGLPEKRELNETFFNEVFPGRQIATEEAFREAVRREIAQHWDAQSRYQLQDQLYHLLLETPMDFPDEFLKKWMQKTAEKPKSADDVEAEFPGFRNQLKWMLISDKLIEDNTIEVSQEELRDNMRKEIMQYFGQIKMDDDTSWMDSYIDRMMKDEKQVESSHRRLINNKLFEWLESRITPVEKETTPAGLTAMQHHHH